MRRIASSRARTRSRSRLGSLWSRPRSRRARSVRPAPSRSAPSPAATCWSRPPGSWWPALIAILMAPRVEQVSPGLGAGKYVAGLAFAVVLYLSVLLHEASHAVTARRFGFPVTSITLHFLGGMTAIEGEARRPREEFWIAVVGPRHLGRGRARRVRPLVRHPGRPAEDGGRGPRRGQPARGRPEPRPGAPPRRGTSAEVGRLGPHRQHAPRNHRGGLGRPHHRRPGAGLPPAPAAADAPGAGAARLPARLRHRGLPLVGLHRRHGLGPAAPEAPRARRPRPGPPHPRRSRRPPARRGRPPGPGGRGRQHRDRHRAAADRSAS